MTLMKLFKMIEDELKAYNTYQRHAEDMRRLGEKDVAIVFEKLAEMEFKHSLWLKKVYQYFGGK